MAEFLCLRCGDERPGFLVPCEQCGLDPRVDDDTLAKSAYLSILRYASDSALQEEYAEELDDIGARLRAGEQVPIDPAEVRRLAEEIDAFRSITGADLARALLVWFAPLLLAVAALLFVLHLIAQHP